MNDSQSIDDISAYDNHIESCGNREWLSSVTVTGHVSRHDLAGGRWPSVYVVETILLKNGLILPKNHTRTNPKTNMATKVLSQVACEKKNFDRALVWFFGWAVLKLSQFAIGLLMHHTTVPAQILPQIK